MATVIGIIVADVLLFVLFVSQYRQELGLTVNGSYDAPAPRRKPFKTPPPPPATPARQTGRQAGQVAVRW